jgi:hypothetical protein
MSFHSDPMGWPRFSIARRRLVWEAVIGAVLVALMLPASSLASKSKPEILQAGASTNNDEPESAEVIILIRTGELETKYQVWLENEGTSSEVAEGEIPASRLEEEVTFKLSHLLPEHTYGLSVLASNADGSVGKGSSFTTFPPLPPGCPDGCPVPVSHEEEEAAAKKKHEEERWNREGAERAAAEAPRLEAERQAKKREEEERPAKEAAERAAKEREARETGERLGREAAEREARLTASIASVLGGELTPTGKAARISALLKIRGYTLTFKALQAGRAVIDWYQEPPAVKPPKKTTAKPILVASGEMSFSAAETAKIKIKLTVAGERLLKNSKSMKLVAKGTFTSAGKTGVSATKAFVLRD